MWVWIQALADWMAHLGKPLAFGLVLLASLLAASGYVVVRLAWRCYLARSWRKRRMQRKSPAGARQ